MSKRIIWYYPIEWLLFWWFAQFILVVSSLQILAHCWQGGHLELSFFAVLVLVWQGSRVWRRVRHSVRGR